MAEQLTEIQIVNQAWQKFVADFSAAHPNLAEAAARIDIERTVVPKLREDAEYVRAMEEYVQGRITVDVVGRVVDIIGRLLPIFLPLIGG